MTNALLISDTSDGGNWGCYATSNELRSILNERVDIQNTIFLNETGVNDLEFIPPNKHDLRYLANETLNSIKNKRGMIRKIYHTAMNTSHLFEILPKTAEQFEHRAKKFVESGLVNNYFNHTGNIDHAIINGEGSIHDSGVSDYRSRSWSLLFLAYVAKKELGFKTHILNHTLEINTKRFQSIVDLVYPFMDSVIFRDPISMSEYKSKTGNKNGVQAADAAWLMENNISKEDLNDYNNSMISLWHPKIKKPKFDFTAPYICIGGGSGLQQSTNKKSKNFGSLVSQIQNEFPNMNILLTAASSADQTFMLNVSEDTEECLLKLNNNHQLAASVLSHSEVYLGGRWHESIFALLGHSQIINFTGNTFKIEALKQHIGSNHPVYSESDIEAKTSTIIDSVRDGIKDGFHDGVPVEDMKSLASRNADII
ncbi:polysaccharide pyruvyl transferase family protein [Halosegnis longus]|uniref:polysaccharide pyruvyl transferase family protein n=1 Tax=Halosegnis longus TaxID=2216012 RepID=UPI0009AE530D|nr:polysaccharide pyruvyl transferase family protein [Salella cibi]